MENNEAYKIDLNDLLNECAKCPELYNKVSNALYKKFNIHSVELSLMITSIVKEINNENK